MATDEREDSPKTLSELVAESQSLRQRLRNKVARFGRELFIEEFRAFFARHPNVDAVKWRQYTPYFNDGEPCHFSVHEPDLCLSDLTDEEVEHCESEEGWLSGWNYPTTRTNLFADVPSVFDEDVMLDLFGDHAEVTVTRDGAVTVEECDHD